MHTLRVDTNLNRNIQAKIHSSNHKLYSCSIIQNYSFKYFLDYLYFIVNLIFKILNFKLNYMCGIFGYIGKGNAVENIINGLKRLEYRGYDSWGVAVIDRKKIEVLKKIGAIGELNNLKELPESNIGIGHTRWATHGGVQEKNAHPHFSSDKKFVLAQNGIVENYQKLKSDLKKKGYQFISETDTEVIVRLVEEKLKTTKSLKEAIHKAFLELEGRNTIILLSAEDNHVIAVRNGSPLVIGVGNDEYFFASDTLSFADKTDQVIYINDNEMVEYKNNKINLFDVKTNDEIEIQTKKLDHNDITVDKEGYNHFMLKEIIEQKHTIREAIQYSNKDLKPLVEAMKKAKIIYTVGAGTAGYAAGQIAYYLRKTAKINCIELKSYEFESYKNIFGENDLIIAVSQSGETADTIETLEFAKEKGMKIASIVNMLGSTITRISDYPYYSRSGPEICVASTKAFTAQVAWGILLAYSIIGKHKQAKDEILSLSRKLSKYFNEKLFAKIKSLNRKLIKQEHFFVLGKGQNFYTALEGALKIKEITYKHFEGFTAGELKHGVIALIEKNTPVFIINSKDDNKYDMLSAAAEVKARGAFVIGIDKENNDLYDQFIKTPEGGIVDSIANIIPFQLISYFLATAMGNDPDKPRNLAKSVTVK